jgi:hypothetical protein
VIFHNLTWLPNWYVLGQMGWQPSKVSKINVILQLEGKHTPFMLNVHHVTHRTNLVVQMLFQLTLVAKIKLMLQFVYNYYSQSPTRSLERSRLSEFKEQKVFKILCNVKTCWISMLSPTKKIFAKYKSLIVHMFDEQTANTSTKKNLDLLCNVMIFLG